MKRLVYRNVYSSEDIVAEDGLISKVKKFVDDLFKSLDKTLSTIESWGEALQEPGATVESLKGNDHMVYEVLPAQDEEDWDKGDVYRLLVKLIDDDEEYMTIKFVIKDKSGNQASDVARLTFPEEDESDADYQKRLREMVDTMTGKLLKKCSDGKYEEVVEYRDVLPGQ